MPSYCVVPCHFLSGVFLSNIAGRGAVIGENIVYSIILVGFRSKTNRRRLVGFLKEPKLKPKPWRRLQIVPPFLVPFHATYKLPRRDDSKHSYKLQSFLWQLSSMTFWRYSAVEVRRGGYLLREYIIPFTPPGRPELRHHEPTGRDHAARPRDRVLPVLGQSAATGQRGERRQLGARAHCAGPRREGAAAKRCSPSGESFAHAQNCSSRDCVLGGRSLERAVVGSAGEPRLLIVGADGRGACAWCAADL